MPITGTIAIGAWTLQQAVVAPFSLAASASDLYADSRSAAGVRQIQDPKGEEAGPDLLRVQAPATRERLMPNYARLFGEAVTDSIRDYYHEHRELLVPGYWLIKFNKRGASIPARTYWCDHEPGNPNNLLDRWPLLFLAGEIAGEVADPLTIFGARERVPIKPRGGLTQEQEYRYQVADLRHARLYRPNEPAVTPRRRVNLQTAPIPTFGDC